MRDEPRCPACGGSLYGWILARATDPRRSETYAVDRCESCGMGVTGGAADEAPSGGREPGGLERVADPAALLERSRAELRPGEMSELRAPNRRSLQAGLGEGHWAALDLPAQRLHLTPRALELLLERHGLEAVRISQPPFGRNQVWMWQTLINAFTFHDNFARELIRGRLTPRTARNVAAFSIDAVVSILAALPVAVISVPAEALAALARRGGELVATVRARAVQTSSRASSASSADASV